MSETTATPNVELEKAQEQVAVAVRNAGAIVESIKDRTTKAKLALSGITAITNKEEDAKANTLLGKVKTTFETVQSERESITKPMDAVKSLLMTYENSISPDPKKADSEYNRVKKLRDAFANAEFQREQENNRRIEAERLKKNELVRVEEVLKTRFCNVVLDAISAMTASIESYFNGLTLEGFDEKIKKFNMKPQLKREVFEAWFIVDYNKNLVPVEDFTKFLDQVKAQFNYDKINTDYVQAATPILEQYIKKLPDLKKNLQEEADMAQKNAAEAERLKKEREAENKRLAEENQKRIDEEKAKNEEASKQAALSRQLDNEFNAQVEQQANKAELASNRKKKVITFTGDFKDVVVIMSKVMFANLTAKPKAIDFIKKDKDGNERYDETGRPVYADWVEELFTFHANHCEEVVEGLSVTEVLSTINRRK